MFRCLSTYHIVLFIFLLALQFHHFFRDAHWFNAIFSSSHLILCFFFCMFGTMCSFLFHIKMKFTFSRTESSHTYSNENDWKKHIPIVILKWILYSHTTYYWLGLVLQWSWWFAWRLAQTKRWCFMIQPGCEMKKRRGKKRNANGTSGKSKRNIYWL